ncbi:MAG: hypothetical protein UX02_C0001G0323 [Candidatus Moranbacteria bacterium GW2011_GWC1_45_18]|nr:MAG: hypothetical protein UT79_C0002G0074 [Candidatus Moranbacteria bacterium GW2011_GWC2_40_12]KKT33775.1 MAG: hypothetical protein UW19_C0005G0021 [Candidatus Moranbacteria bacterium GW2011_GWF2_44_10]KKU00875.1 MAG: hypothetical protein UX02_C0001G0323 [Candidatus Moranbacteria bacterium GW2011_GWC1_45_18]OGI42295.1 MAG: hypothetical protein A2593_02815 [Candidatus Moranbacteria bacterium RIFOXYD1_FULL_44_9]HBB37423.1 hypothetical protein [Candidatus Moranbacteria bacterium]
MYCLVDFRNRPQYKYTFSKQEKARECLKRIKNNPLGVTVFFADGRREYFETGIPQGFFAPSKKIIQIKKGCHVKYQIRAMNNLDGVLKKQSPFETASTANWQNKSALSLFMLGNRKIYAGLAVASLLMFASSFYFQKQSTQSAAAVTESASQIEGQVAGAADAKINEEEGGESLKLADDEIIMNLLGKIEEKKQGEFEAEILRYIKGRPMEAMAPYIAQQPRMVAAFIVGIAMKESKFGVYAPHSNGRDCLNYWGYRGPENTTASGYSCFDSPEHAVQVIGKKISKLVAQGISNPSEMISWKCGSTCAGHGAESVRKWIADVGVNFYKINSKENS